MTMRGRTGLEKLIKRKWSYRRVVQTLLYLCCVLIAARWYYLMLPTQSLTSNAQSPTLPGPCAINLYGLPRSFATLVLPSLIRNVIEPNAAYQCDYYVHYYDVEQDPVGRDGRGGTVDAEEILLLAGAIQRVMNSTGYQPLVQFDKITEADFRVQYATLLETIHTAKSEHGHFLYRPFKHPSYTNATIDNVIKMWHGQQAVWSLMQASGRHYSRIAMLRADVVYLTPLDLYRVGDRMDTDNRYAVIPDFSNHPVNDRLIYGPYDAVRIWAAGRFERLEQHVHRLAVEAPGNGLHSELFLYHTLFPAIRDAGVEIRPDPGICFFRTRSDQSMRMDDCGWRYASDHYQQVVEYMIVRSCRQNRTATGLIHLECADNTN